MDKDLIVRLARDADLRVYEADGQPYIDIYDYAKNGYFLLADFAKVVAEECAKVADSSRMGLPGYVGQGPTPVLYRGDIGAAIRAKFTKE